MLYLLIGLYIMYVVHVGYVNFMFIYAIEKSWYKWYQRVFLIVCTLLPPLGTLYLIIEDKFILTKKEND